MRFFKFNIKLFWWKHWFRIATFHNFWRSENKIPSESCNRPLQGNWLISGSLRHFDHLKMCFWEGHECLESRVYCFGCVTVRVFYCLKISFLRFPEILGLRLRGHRWGHVRNFGGLKKRFLAGLKKISSSVHDLLSEPFFAFWRHNIRPAIVQPGFWTRRLAFRHYSGKEAGKVVETSGYRTEEEFQKLPRGPKGNPKKWAQKNF